MGRRSARNVLLVGVDSVRADHLSLYGYPRRTTPVLERFLERHGGVVYDRLSAVSPSCHPSHTTLLTGLFPQQVGVPLCGEDLIFRLSDADSDRAMARLKAVQDDLASRPPGLLRRRRSAVINTLRIPEGTETLATFLKRHGYATAAFVGIWTITRRFGYGRGFDVFEDSMPEYYGPRLLAPLLKHGFKSQRRQDVRPSVDAALEWMKDCPASQPFFVFLQLARTHVPYAAPPDVDFAGETGADRERLQDAWRCRYPEANHGPAMKKMGYGRGRFLLDEYDRSIKYSDEQIGRVLGYLEESGRLEDTLVIYVADHGDSFGQHRFLSGPRKDWLFFEHTVYLWEETQHLPLVILDPSRRGRVERHAGNVSQVDVVPTVRASLGLADERFGDNCLPGADLLALPDRPRPVYFLTFGRGRPGLLHEATLGYPTYVGMREGDAKFVVEQARFRHPDRGRAYAHDLTSDPDEMDNLCGPGSIDEDQHRRRARLVAWYAASVAGRDRALPPAGGAR